MWHDANPKFSKNHTWIKDVCEAIEYLIKKGFIGGNFLIVENSWVLVWQKTKN